MDSGISAESNIGKANPLYIATQTCRRARQFSRKGLQNAQRHSTYCSVQLILLPWEEELVGTVCTLYVQRSH